MCLAAVQALSTVLCMVSAVTSLCQHGNSSALQVLEHRELARKWQDALQRVPSSPQLWSQYFTFLASHDRQTSLRDLEACCVDSTMALAKQAAMLSHPPQGASVDVPAQRQAERAAIDAAMRHVSLLFGSGATQRAVALLQASLEWAAFPCHTLGAHPMWHVIVFQLYKLDVHHRCQLQRCGTMIMLVRTHEPLTRNQAQALKVCRGRRRAGTLVPCFLDELRAQGRAGRGQGFCAVGGRAAWSSCCAAN
jgi:NRDE-2, necessary for RNA interference